MSQQVTLGGDRLGAGKKQTVSLHSYERSTHDLSSAWRSSMSAGTLVPFMNLLALPGDSWDIDLECEVMTLPTLGPLFGSFKVQLDVFEIPLRLYNGKLHMNLLGVGLNMEDIKLPQIILSAQRSLTYTDNEQINPSSLPAYLGMRGIGRPAAAGTDDINRYFNASSILGFWDIFKQYYSNKMEDFAYVIHNPMTQSNSLNIIRGTFRDANGTSIGIVTPSVNTSIEWANVNRLEILFEIPNELEGQQLGLNFSTFDIVLDGPINVPLTDLFLNITASFIGNQGIIQCTGYIGEYGTSLDTSLDASIALTSAVWNNNRPNLVSFPLSNIDDMRKAILTAVDATSAFVLNDVNIIPYSYLHTQGDNGYSIRSSQEGLPVKTYQSDLFNNWLNTEFISGTNGINEITSVDTTGDSFTIDALNLASKVYAMLNRIAVSGGTYDDWLNAVYTHERTRSVENPIYHGSLIKELAFQEVISNASTDVNGVTQPLGELAGRGKMTDKHKGGRMRIKVHEPSIIMGIVSLTPRIDYSQGNDWTVNLKTFNDFHKPALDAIGFQDLVTDQMAWFDTTVDSSGVPTFKSAGKQPAWLNYMTDVNRTYGNFAIAEKEMFMTLNRRYEAGLDGITDLTTYIDPVIYNQIFAQPDLSAQNFWVQIGKGIQVRRKMSAKIIPNL